MIRPRTLICIIVAAIALLHGWWILHFGMKWGADIDRLSAWADRLIAYRFNFAAYFE